MGYAIGQRKTAHRANIARLVRDIRESADRVAEYVDGDAATCLRQIAAALTELAEYVTLVDAAEDRE